jgi:flagellar motor component MotA
LKECAPAIGLDIGRLTALEAQLGNLTVTSGIGARITEANVGTFKQATFR